MTRQLPGRRQDQSHVSRPAQTGGELAALGGAIAGFGARIRAGGENIDNLNQFLSDPQIVALANLFWDSDKISGNVRNPVVRSGVIPLAEVPTDHHAQSIRWELAKTMEGPLPHRILETSCALGLFIDESGTASLVASGYHIDSIANTRKMEQVNPRGESHVGEPDNTKMFALTKGEMARVDPKLVIDGFAKFIHWASVQADLFGPNAEQSEVVTAMKEGIAAMKTVRSRVIPGPELPGTRRLSGQ